MKIVPIKIEDRNKKRCVYELLKVIDKEEEIKSFVVILQKENNEYHIGESNMNFGLIGAIEYMKQNTLATWDEE